ncbi:Protein disulfide-isomerase 2-3 [Nosema granulosis]|uniref:Protein disulfide-isomerase 2-3 n=1 Tax=Nosema granulosis TaxID=83296 RepID=A0A9P6KZP4_9MICR|nr:Protein disulfide-isomerase 2-3 [Nosema granulosis]
MLSLLLLLQLSLQIAQDGCEQRTEGLVLTDYYMKWCHACQALDPVLDEIGNHLERNGVDLFIEKIDCEKCKVTDKSIQAYPTVVLRDNGKEIARFNGKKTYNQVRDFLLEHTNIPSDAFEGHVETTAGHIHDLTDTDMYQGLDGAWLVLFYYKGHQMFDGLLTEIAKIYDGKINIGRISYKESKDFIQRLNIKSYPAMFGFYNGLSVPYVDNLNLNEISKFCDKLTESVLDEIDYNTFHEKSAMLESGEPIYLVLNKNNTLANEYFYNYAHMYRYKVKMYKSSDPKLFERASIYPQEIKDEADHNTHKHAVKLAVYKNGVFYEYTGHIGDEEEISAWIFHTHFGYVTRIENSTFNTIFNGFKPSMILITKEEQYLKEYNNFSADRHLGTPYLDILFSYLDTNQYDLFVPSLLPKIDVPSLVIYDPASKHFRYKPTRLTKENFKQVAMETIKRYEKGTLPLYPPAFSYIKYYILGIGFFITCVLLITKSTKSKKRI